MYVCVYMYNICIYVCVSSSCASPKALWYKCPKIRLAAALFSHSMSFREQASSSMYSDVMFLISGEAMSYDRDAHV